jgi:hypothetical protein
MIALLCIIVKSSSELSSFLLKGIKIIFCLFYKIIFHFSIQNILTVLGK